jgi:hypothetical protein
MLSLKQDGVPALDYFDSVDDISYGTDDEYVVITSNHAGAVNQWRI